MSSTRRSSSSLMTAELWKPLGDVLVELQRFDHALLSFQHVLKLDPRHPDALYKSGALLNQFGRYEEALAHLDLCDELLPNHLRRCRRARGALQSEKARRGAGGRPAGDTRSIRTSRHLQHIGVCVAPLGREEEALAMVRQGLLQLRRTLARPSTTRSFAAGQLHRFNEVFALYDRIRALRLDNAATEWNVALAASPDRQFRSRLART